MIQIDKAEFDERKAKRRSKKMKEYDTLVCEAVKKDPLAFVDALQKEAESADRSEHPSWAYALPLREAACVIANLLLTEEEWHKITKEDKS